MPITRQMLEDCFDSTKLCESLWDRIERIRSRVERITAVYSETPKGGGANDKIGNGVAELDKLRREFQEETDAWALLQTEVNEAIQGLESPRMRNIMGLRYLDGRKWAEVAEMAGYEERQCYRLHDEALVLLGIKDVSDCQSAM